MESILGLIRHVLTFGGGYAASQGFINQDDATALVGAIVTIVGVVWSTLSKQPNIPIK